jgi:hypothetical protein
LGESEIIVPLILHEVHACEFVPDDQASPVHHSASFLFVTTTSFHDPCLNKNLGISLYRLAYARLHFFNNNNNNRGADSCAFSEYSD